MYTAATSDPLPLEPPKTVWGPFLVIRSRSEEDFQILEFLEPEFHRL